MVRTIFFIILAVGILALFDDVSASSAYTAQSKANIGLPSLTRTPPKVEKPLKEAPAPAQPPEPPPIDCRSQSCIALTFDDGPSPHTRRLLDVLKDQKVKATFYMLGVYVERHADVVKRVAEEGHQIGNHTWVHQNLLKMNDQEVRAEVDRTNDVIKRVSGVKPDTMRPPFGLADERIQKVSELPQILWDVDPYDWRDQDPAIIAGHVVSAAERGSIVLVHDIYPATVDAVPQIITGLRAKGLEPVTINTMLNNGQPPALGEYFRQAL